MTPDRWDDLVAVLGSSGGDGGCWDMFWRLTASEYAASSRDRNRASLREFVDLTAPLTGITIIRDPLLTPDGGRVVYTVDRSGIELFSSRLEPQTSPPVP